MKTKVIAWYLPQFHCIPENDEFWGKGFTDWVTVKKAKSLCRGHIQPRVPLSENYYDLSVADNVVWQSRLAKEYGVSGFGVYHYWFNNEKNLLTKPAEIIRDNEEVEIDYFLAWDNASWKRSWSNVEGNDWAPVQDQKLTKSANGPSILIPYILGREKDWENHYNYLRSHFASRRYMKKDNKPVFVILKYSDDIHEMCQYWDSLAKKDGFDGMFFIFKYSGISVPENYKQFVYEPVFHFNHNRTLIDKIAVKIKKHLLYKGIRTFNYSKLWKKIVSDIPSDDQNLYPGAFVGYDDTPRRAFRGTVVNEASPQLFKKYLKEILKAANASNKEFIFLTAWNEWGEGAYLEPDTLTGYSYLEALSSAIKETCQEC